MPSTDRAALLRRIPAQLRKVFGLRRLRPGQHEAITRSLRGLNTLAVMPTGAGKSLCYQLPATLLKGVTVVVSPLIALMQDQCDKLAALGIPAVQLNSALSAEAAAEAERALAAREVRVVFVTPERLAEPGFQAGVRGQVALLVVDEAHCISQWGHDFRPAFTQIGALLPALGGPPVLALTATANEAVMADIAAQLKIPAAGVQTASSYRPALAFAVEPVADEAAKLARALAALRAAPGPAIVYTATVKAAEQLHEHLAEAGIAAGLYHGRLPAARRREAQADFMAARTAVMVATNAFGLGIDRPDIRLVLHYQLPAGLDVYYQEAGRAGRDGEAARCLLLFQASDRAVQQFFMRGRYPTQDDGQAVLQALRDATAPLTADALKAQLQRPAGKLGVVLNLLRREGWITVDAEGAIGLRDANSSAEAGLPALFARYESKREDDAARLEQLVAYAQSGACRWRLMLEAFDEAPPFEGGRCQGCDNCRRIAAHEREQTAAAIELPGGLATRPAAAPVFSAGDTVKVKRYGLGSVVEASSESVTVSFGPAGPTRCFHPDYVKPTRPASAPRRKRSVIQAPVLTA